MPPDNLDDRDVPIHTRQFLKHVRTFKALLGLSLLSSIVLEILHVTDWISRYGNDVRHQRGLVLWEGISDGLGLSLILLSLVVYIYSLARRIRRTPEGLLTNLSIHRTLCQTTFFIAILLLIAHALPGIIYTLITHRAAPNVHSNGLLGTPRIVALICTLFAAGLSRRGPKLHYTPVNLGSGFGINDAKKIRNSDPVKGKPNGWDEDAEDTLLSKEEGEYQNVLDYSNSSMLSFIFLTYMASLLKRSMAVEQLLPTDLPYMEEENRRAGADHDLQSSFTRKQAIELPTMVGKITRLMLVRALWKGRGMVIFITFCVETIITFFSYLQIYSMHEIINAFDNPRSEDERAYAWLMCWGLFVGQSTECILSAYSSARENYLLHIPVKMSVASLIFRKILRTTDVKTVEAHHLTEAETESGKGRSEVINLLTIDSHAMASLATHVWDASNALIALVIGVVFLYKMFGVSALIGIAAFLFSVPLSVYVSRQSYIADRVWSRARDARASAIKEFLLCYKVIKLNAFEPYFRRRIERLRDFEVVWQRWRFTLGTIFNVLADQLPNLAILVMFSCYTKLFGHRLEPASAFVALSVFGRVKAGLQFIPSFIQKLSNTLVALNRLVAFLNRPEVNLEEWERDESEIEFKQATLAWPLPEVNDVDTGAFRLKDVTLNIPKGKITLLCGPLGAGKSLLLRSMLGETVIEHGSMRAPRTHTDATPLNGSAVAGPFQTSTWLDDSVAYAPQQAYIRHGTIRDNILFGQPMWRARYNEALREASLQSDLRLFEDGDLTEVGDHGVNLSGGQRARVNLARCLYARSRTVYLDDILSAVDAHTAQFIVEECFAGPLLEDRTVVLVSHHVALCLSIAEYVVGLRDGTVDQACPVSEVKMDVLAELEPPSPTEEVSSPSSKALQLQSVDAMNEDRVMREEEARETRLHYKAEQSSIGRVATNHYMLVLKSAGGVFYWLVFALIFGSAILVNQILLPLLFRGWSGDSDPAHLNSRLVVYLILTTTGIAIGAMSWIWLYGVGNLGFYNRGSRAIHAMLLDMICTAPLRFFEETPKGRIMNIFGQDMFRLDGSSADDFGRTITAALLVATSALMVCFQAPALLVILIVFGAPLYWLSNVLGRLRADLRRLAAVATSPLISLYSDAIEGIVMVRAFGTSHAMLAAMQLLMNRERQAWAADFLAYSWIRGLVRAVASIFVTATGFVLLGSNASGPQVGFILLFAMNASQGLFGLLECYSNLEQTFVSAERINHYVTMDVAETTEGVVPEKTWPNRGAIRVQKLSVKYAEDLPEVLHDVSFNVEPGMRVGLVGSTGSGKSTLALTLFRAIEAHCGSIEIDGMDIRNVKLQELRGRLNMVVQEGTLCSGTLRDALDITGAIDDVEIYSALRRVHLIPDNPTAEDRKSNPFMDLDQFVAVEGANFSHGERQLLCLARALLKPSKILVMDEATSSVDFEYAKRHLMDAQITQTIKECFGATTMIVIAHRLATIMHYDRVLVLDKGQVKEYGSPADLIKDTTSAFRKLCMAQGKEEYDKLAAMVQK